MRHKEQLALCEEQSRAYQEAFQRSLLVLEELLFQGRLLDENDRQKVREVLMNYSYLRTPVDLGSADGMPNAAETAPGTLFTRGLYLPEGSESVSQPLKKKLRSESAAPYISAASTISISSLPQSVPPQAESSQPLLMPNLMSVLPRMIPAEDSRAEKLSKSLYNDNEQDKHATVRFPDKAVPPPPVRAEISGNVEQVMAWFANRQHGSV